MIEMRKARPATKKLLELLLERGALRVFGALACTRGRVGAAGQRDGATIGKLQLIFVQATLESEPRNVRRLLTAQFFFFDGKQNGVLVDERDRRTASQCRDAEYVHD
jgi:hypothetical protein